MRNLDSVTLLCLDTRDPDAALLSMQKCMEQVNFAKAVLLTHPGYKSADSRISVQAVSFVKSIEDYSRFIIKELGAYFATRHVLVAQWDGFVVNPDVWDDEFLKYDYIGAPWMNHRHAVGNGGFSLRSRKLQEALKDETINELDPEDYAICDRYHDLLMEKYGISFAPILVARRFSCETFKPSFLSFGVHGVGSVHWVTSDQEHLEFLKRVPKSMLLNSTGRTLIKDCIDTKKPLSARYILDIRRAEGTIYQKFDAAKLKLKLLLNLRKKREAVLIYSVAEPNPFRQKAQFSIERWFKKYIQRGIVLLLTGQRLLQSDVAPSNAKKILWIYDWHMLGDCILPQEQRMQLSLRYQLDICVTTGPLSVFKNNTAFRNVYRSIQECPKDYDFILVNDINSRSIGLKVKRYFSKPWTALVGNLDSNHYRRLDFVSIRVKQIFGIEF